jgi:hypothetical protein
MTAGKVVETGASLDDWIDGATFLQVKVDIHRNPALYSELKPLYELIEVAESRLEEARREAEHAAATTDAALGQDAPVATVSADSALGETARTPEAVEAARADLEALLEQADEIYARYDADKETWTIRALDRETEISPIVSRYRLPELPLRREKEPQARFTARTEAYVKEVQRIKGEIDEQGLVLAIVDVVVGGEHKPPPGIEGLRRLRARPHGQQHFDQLVNAMNEVTLEEVAIIAPHRSGA